MSMHENNGKSKIAAVVEMKPNTENRTMTMPQISLSFNNAGVRSQCTLCGCDFEPSVGWWPFIGCDYKRIVCLDCASQHPVRLPPDPGCYAKVLSAIPANTSVVEHWDGEPYALVRFDHGDVIVEDLNPCPRRSDGSGRVLPRSGSGSARPDPRRRPRMSECRSPRPRRSGARHSGRGQGAEANGRPCIRAGPEQPEAGLDGSRYRKAGMRRAARRRGAALGQAG
jgi:hypothetical protein